MRVNVGKRIFNEPNGVFRTISVFSEKEPEPEVNQIREFRPNLAEILAAAERDIAAGKLVEPDADQIKLIEELIESVAVTPPAAPEQPAKPKRIWKPRPNRKKGAKPS